MIWHFFDFDSLLSCDDKQRIRASNGEMSREIGAEIKSEINNLTDNLKHYSRFSL